MPLHFAANTTLSYLHEVLTTIPLSILEVGCGNGLVAAGLVSRGHAVTAIDSSESAVETTRASGMTAIHSSLEEFEHSPFDVLFFGRSLHHIHHLEHGLNHAATLLKPHGLIVLEEFGVERPDEATARWFYNQVDELTRSDGMCRDDHDPRSDVEPLERWRMEHQYEPPLHTSLEMKQAIESRFDLKNERSGPNLFRTFCNRLASLPHGLEKAGEIYEREIDAIDSGEIIPVGMRIVASLS